MSVAFGVATGIPLEFQFGTNWATFSNFAGGVIGQTLAIEGMFAFFLESSFLGILLFGEQRCRQCVQWFAALMLFLGSWLSGYFILATNAWMQHPVAYSVAPDEGLFKTERGAGLLLIGQPNIETMTIDNLLIVPDALSVVVYDELYAEVKGLDAFPREGWPDNLPLLYYSYPVMVGLGTILVSVMGLALLWRGRLFTTNWPLMLSALFPYIATTAGWMTAEIGRHPWLVYGLLRRADGASPLVHSGHALFTLRGFLGIYLVLRLLFLFLMAETIRHGLSGHSVSPEYA